MNTLKAFSGAAVVAGLLVAGPAFAQSPNSYSADDIIAHFAESANLGASRGLCIGTESECGAPVERPKPFDLRVQFPLGSAELTAEARSKLDTFAEAAADQRLERARFFIDGHTDGRGDEALNQDLSQRRAQSVVRYLTAKGIDTDKLIPRGYGESKPLTDDVFDDENRRVEASLAGVE